MGPHTDMASTTLLHCLLLFCVSAAFTVGVHAKCYDADKDRDFECPTENDRWDEIHCCGEFDKQRCCDFEEHKEHGTVISDKATAVIVGLVVMFICIIFICMCCCCCCQCCFLYKYRQRRRGATMIPMQPVAPVPSRDEAGRPLYPIQQYYPTPEPGYPPQNAPEGIPLTAQPNYDESGGVYPTKQLSNLPDQVSSQPFTYGPAPMAGHQENK